MRIAEIQPAKPLTPDQQRIRAMQARVKQAQQAVKAERARQKIRAGQAALAKSWPRMSILSSAQARCKLILGNRAGQANSD